ncbi:glycosyltransferase family 9 protein [Niveibacterium terrae]|uniref:glycosyltransferase family 9 protein n=1 Tax=Niveibacterium terrae TaxID=3373598 RepID=UPI003A8F3082
MAPPWLKKSPLYRIERARRAALLLAVNRLLPRAPQTSTTRRKVAFVKRGGIGDWILFAPVLETIRARFPTPEWELTVYCEPPQRGIAEMVGLCDRIEVLDPKSFRKSFSCRRARLTQIRREAYEVWFDADIDRTNSGDALALASAAPVRIGFEADPLSCHRLIERRVFTTVLPDPINTVPMQQRMRVLAEALPGETPSAPLPASGLRRYCWSGSGADFFLVAPGASTSIRTWPAERFAELCRVIQRETGLRPVLIGGTADAQASSRLTTLLAPDLEVENLTGKTTLAGLFELIASARLLVTNESGPMHIGHGAGTPTLAIVSGADFTSYCSSPNSPTFQVVSAPDHGCFDCRWNCIHPVANRQGIRKCLADVTIEAAIGAARSLIETSSRHE